MHACGRGLPSPPPRFGLASRWGVGGLSPWQQRQRPGLDCYGRRVCRAPPMMRIASVVWELPASVAAASRRSGWVGGSVGGFGELTKRPRGDNAAPVLQIRGRGRALVPLRWLPRFAAAGCCRRLHPGRPGVGGLAYFHVDMPPPPPPFHLCCGRRSFGTCEHVYALVSSRHGAAGDSRFLLLRLAKDQNTELLKATIWSTHVSPV